ncbi:MAG: enoyl-CoA hydratase/isomerase family protein [Desulfurella sp.]
MERFLIKQKEKIAYIIMNNKENKHDIVFANEFLEALNYCISDKTINSIIITSSDEKNFSQGIDVDWVHKNLKEKNYDIVKKFLYKINEMFEKIIFSCVPTIAQINGHAFGNGALLACACDFRFSRKDKGFFCFPEVDIGIPFLPSMIEFSKKAINYQFYQQIVFTGKRCIADELEKEGVILKAAASLEELELTTFEFAKTLNKNRSIYQKLKNRIFANIKEAFEKDKQYIENLDIFV